MYPENPDKPAVRRAAAALARARGVPIPADFDGSDESMQRLMKEGPQHFAALTYAFNEYTATNPGNFPALNVETAKAWLLRNPTPSGYADKYKREALGLSDIAEGAKAGIAGGAEYLRKNFTPGGIAESFGEGVGTVKGLAGSKEHAPGIGWGWVIAGGVVIGLIAASSKKGAA